MVAQKALDQDSVGRSILSLCLLFTLMSEVAILAPTATSAGEHSRSAHSGHPNGQSSGLGQLPWESHPAKPRFFMPDFPTFGVAPGHLIDVPIWTGLCEWPEWLAKGVVKMEDLIRPIVTLMYSCLNHISIQNTHGIPCRILVSALTGMCVWVLQIQIHLLFQKLSPFLPCSLHSLLSFFLLLQTLQRILFSM